MYVVGPIVENDYQEIIKTLIWIGNYFESRSPALEFEKISNIGWRAAVRPVLQ